MRSAPPITCKACNRRRSLNRLLRRAAARAGDPLATSRTLIQITGYDCTKGNS